MKGIVLLGGKSSRMGTDKGFLISKNETFFYDFAAKKLATFCDEVYLSINGLQNQNNTFEYPVIVDKEVSVGPIGGIITSYEKLHDNLLVLACDMPLVSIEDIQFLMSKYLKQQQSCFYFDYKMKHFEPLVSIWTTPLLAKLKMYYEVEGRSLNAFLKNNDVAKIEISDSTKFSNINTTHDWEMYQKYITDQLS